jgi:rhodanese-related sulfurtransferase
VAEPTRRYHVWSALRPTSLRLDVDAVRELVAAGALLIDVRRQEDESARIEGARRIPPDEIPSLVATLPRGTAIVLACT